MFAACLLAATVLAATPGIDPVGPSGEVPLILELELAPRLPAPNPVPWTQGPRTRTDWAALVDATWGPNQNPPEIQLAVYSTFWSFIHHDFACFHDIDDLWLDFVDADTTEIAAGVSRGRFAGILSRMSLSLRESHTKAYDSTVTNTFAGRGVPLLYAYDLGARAGDLGAAVTALNDGTGLVYLTHADNPLGLAPGDIILGYDGRPWSDCLAELLAAELPVKGMWGSSPSSWEHHWTAAVGANWHLFDTMDVVEHATGETVHLATGAVDGYDHALYGSEQLDVGIPFPDLANEETVTWGVIERDGQRIGYIYVFGWTYTAGADFYAAVDDLTTNHDTAGLIVDFRRNIGGNMFLSDAALGLLFAEEAPTIEWFERCNANDHLALCNQHVWQYYVIDPDPADRFYDRPIAVLTGPGAVSSGDQVALRMTYHPQARVFGKSTAAAFNAPEFTQIGTAIYCNYAYAECARLDALDAPLTHLDFPVDEPVWLEPDDVAQGIDTVVEAAADWIVSQVGVLDPTLPGESGTPAAVTRFVGARPNPFNPATALVFSLARPTRAELTVYDLAGRRVRGFPLPELAAGEHRVTWDGRSDAGIRQPSGSYLVRLRTDERISTGRVMLVE